jgi:hypothetical protein
MARIYLVAVSALLGIFSLTSDLSAQGDDWYVSVANYARYYYFKDTKADSSATRFQFDLYMDRFYMGGWYELQHVMGGDFGNITNNDITQRYFGWENDGLTIHAGTFYQVFDRGLILNTFRDDDVGVDYVLDGLQLNWRQQYFDLDAISATPGIGGGFGKAALRGGRLKLKPANLFHLGGAYVSYIPDNRDNLSQVNARINLDYIDAYVEYARRKYREFNFDDPLNPLSKGGDGTYANVTGYYSYFTAMFEYKNYIFLIYPEAGYLNIPPAVNRQDRLIRSELANYVYITNPLNGERGYRGNLTASWSDYWGVEVDYARAYSRDDSLSLVLTETFFEIRGNYFEQNTFHANLDFFEFTLRDELRSELEFTYFLNDFNALELLAYQINYEPLDSVSYSEKFLDLSYIKTPDFRLTVGGSITDNENPEGKKRMAHAELTLTFDSHEFVIFYGGQRGGLVCSGGVCTYHPTFEGLRLILHSRF